MRVLRQRGKLTEDNQPTRQPVFHGLVVKVDCPSDKLSTKHILLAKLEEGGAQSAQRLRKDLTHVVFVRQGDAEDDLKRINRIREFERKNAGSSLILVSPLWVEECTNQNARLDEADFCPVKSFENESNKRTREFLMPTRLSLETEVGHKKRKKEKTPRGGTVPKPIDHFKMDHASLDSARKLKECHDFYENVTPVGEATQDAALTLSKNLCNALEIPESVVTEDALDTPLNKRCSQRLSEEKMKEETKGTQPRKEETKKKKNQPSQRFSLRRLFVYPERKVLLDKNLPIEPVQAKPVLKKTLGAGVPIPEVERVPSPWRTPTTQSDVNGVGDTVSTATKSKGTPFTKKRVPSPWSTLRPWDIMKKRKSLLSQQSSKVSPLSQIKENLTSGMKMRNSASSPRKYQLEGISAKVSPTAGSFARAKNPSPLSIGLSQEMLTIPTTSQITTSQESQPKFREISGMLAVTSVKGSVLDLCKTAVTKLPGLNLWANNSRKSGRITHLIIGDNRRTLKTMLAVLHGAYMLTPEYVTASLEAGYWLPEEAYLAEVVFQEGATKSREARSLFDAVSNRSGLLQGKKVSICTQGKSSRDDSYQVVRKICQELGATLFHISEAEICIMMNDNASSRPSDIPVNARAVRKEWLFQSACAYELIDMTDFLVPQEMA